MFHLGYPSCSLVHYCIFAYPILLYPQSKIPFCPEVVLEKSHFWGTLVERRLHPTISEGKGFPMATNKDFDTG